METKKIELTKKQKENLCNYLESRLGIYGVKSYRFKTEDDGDLYQEMDPSYYGLMGLICRKVTLNVRLWKSDEENESLRASLYLSYEHHNIGSNGHDINLELYIRSDGKVYEREQKRCAL